MTCFPLNSNFHIIKNFEFFVTKERFYLKTNMYLFEQHSPKEVIHVKPTDVITYQSKSGAFFSPHFVQFINGHKEQR